MYLMKESIMNPVFYERNKDGEVFYDIQSRLIKDRVIFLCEPVTQDVAGIISSLLFMMNNEDPKAKISIWLNTPGGDAHAFFAIYDMIQMIQAPVETVCIGMAMSAGALLLSSGSKGKRFALPNSKIMIHQIQIGGVGGTGTEVMIETSEIKKMNDTIAEILARHTGNPLEKVQDDCEHNMYLTAKEALDYGIIDNIMPVSKKIPALVKPSTLSVKKAAKKPAAKKVPAKKVPAKKATKKTASNKD
jgi:ATP-dependent Clp protease protease subunit